MHADLYHSVRDCGASVDLSRRAKWRLDGSDRVRYLNGQITNDVRLATSGSAIYACVTNAKGRIEADVFIHTHPADPALLVDAEPALRDTLGPRLEKYIIADDVELQDLTDEWSLWHAWGAAAPAWHDFSAKNGGHTATAARVVPDGLDIWLPASVPAAPVPDQVRAVAPVLSAEQYETWRVLVGIPRFPHELDAGVFPQEAGLEDRALSYTKGCYIGQEILSRIKSTGKMPRQLIAWHAEAPGEVAPGDTLWHAAGADSREVGRVTSAVRHPDTGRAVGLALVKHGSCPRDSKLLVGGPARNPSFLVSCN